MNILRIIEIREDGGTPGFLQGIRTAMVFQLKATMSVEKIIAREQEIITYMFAQFSTIPEINLFAEDHKDRLGIFSFTVKNAHYNLVVKIIERQVWHPNQRRMCVCWHIWALFNEFRC